MGNLLFSFLAALLLMTPIWITIIVVAWFTFHAWKSWVAFWERWEDSKAEAMVKVVIHDALDEEFAVDLADLYEHLGLVEKWGWPPNCVRVQL